MSCCAQSQHPYMEALKLRLAQARARQAEADIEAGSLVDGEAFFDEIQNGLRD